MLLRLWLARSDILNFTWTVGKMIQESKRYKDVFEALFDDPELAAKAREEAEKRMKEEEKND